jgi:hypothetical protein
MSAEGIDVKAMAEARKGPDPNEILECKRCDCRNEHPDQLTKYLRQAHGYSESEARLEADAENERLYPKFKAPPGKFSVLWVDIARSQGGVIKHCATPEEAKALADQDKWYPQTFVFDGSGRELYAVKR